MFSSGEWLNIDDKYEFAMDHGDIVAEARKALARDLLSRPLLLSFLPAEFTMPELQKLYEAILGRSVDRGNFRKRILKLNILDKTGEIKANTGQRPPELYRLNRSNYLNSLTDGDPTGASESPTGAAGPPFAATHVELSRCRGEETERYLSRNRSWFPGDMRLRISVDENRNPFLTQNPGPNGFERPTHHGSTHEPSSWG